MIVWLDVVFVFTEVTTTTRTTTNRNLSGLLQNKHLFLPSLVLCVFSSWDPWWWSGLQVADSGLMGKSKNRDVLRPLQSHLNLLLRCAVSCMSAVSKVSSPEPGWSVSHENGQRCSNRLQGGSEELEKIAQPLKPWLNTFMLGLHWTVSVKKSEKKKKK